MLLIDSRGTCGKSGAVNTAVTVACPTPLVLVADWFHIFFVVLDTDSGGVLFVHTTRQYSGSGKILLLLLALLLLILLLLLLSPLTLSREPIHFLKIDIVVRAAALVALHGTCGCACVSLSYMLLRCL